MDQPTSPRRKRNPNPAEEQGSASFPEEITTDFVYVRLHGSQQLYVSGYGDDELEHWANLVRRWAARDGFVHYFDNDAKVHVPRNARNPAVKISDVLA